MNGCENLNKKSIETAYVTEKCECVENCAFNHYHVIVHDEHQLVSRMEAHRSCLHIEFIDCEVFRKFLVSTLIVVTLWR